MPEQPKLFEGWHDDRGHCLLGQVRGRPRERSVGAHAPGIRAGIAVQRPFVVLRGQQRHSCLAVGEREDRYLGTVEELLDHHDAADLGVAHRRTAVGGDDDALARREPVSLHHIRRAESVERRRDLGRTAAGHRSGCRHAGGDHHLLRE